jgi:hypothetical protein
MFFHEGKYLTTRANIFLQGKIFFRDRKMFFSDGKIQDFKFFPMKIYFSMTEKYVI